MVITRWLLRSPVAICLSVSVGSVFSGVRGHILLRVILIAFVVALLNLPLFKLAGGVLLLWIGVRLMAPTHDPHANVKSADEMIGAIKTIVMADIVMSLDM